MKSKMASILESFWISLCIFTLFLHAEAKLHSPHLPLRFGRNGHFKILQVADMHYANGRTTPCKDVLPEQYATCSDLNTTAFLRRILRAEKPDLVVFTGDNIYAFDTTDAAKSMDEAFAPVVKSKIPWAAVLGNHDQESALSRERVMQHIVVMEGSISRIQPTAAEELDGYGNYNVEVMGSEGSRLHNRSLLNLYFLDSLDYSTVPSVSFYDWIKPSQLLWFQRTSARLQKEQKSEPGGKQDEPTPGLAYFHIPLSEYASLDSSNVKGVKQEAVCSASVSSGFFATLVEAGDVKAVFTGHDHVNDFCGKVDGIHLCYAGGFGYHAYGKAGWARRARVVSAALEKSNDGGWGVLKSITTWKRLDDERLSTIDIQKLWSINKSPGGPRPKQLLVNS